MEILLAMVVMAQTFVWLIAWLINLYVSNQAINRKIRRTCSKGPDQVLHRVLGVEVLKRASVNNQNNKSINRWTVSPVHGLFACAVWFFSTILLNRTHFSFVLCTHIRLGRDWTGWILIRKLYHGSYDSWQHRMPSDNSAAKNADFVSRMSDSFPTTTYVV